jgi:hypothetical protein
VRRRRIGLVRLIDCLVEPAHFPTVPLTTLFSRQHPDSREWRPLLIRPVEKQNKFRWLGLKRSARRLSLHRAKAGFFLMRRGPAIVCSRRRRSSCSPTQSTSACGVFLYRRDRPRRGKRGSRQSVISVVTLLWQPYARHFSFEYTKPCRSKAWATTRELQLF